MSPTQQFAAKATFGAGAALFGLRAAQDPVVTVFFLLIGLAIGHEIDKRCPQCGQILQLVEFLG